MTEGGSCKGWLSIGFLRHVEALIVADKYMLDNGSQARHLGATSVGDVVRVHWQCSQCWRRPEAIEHINSLMIEVDEPPQISYPITYRKVEE